jgi:hypothetical protein
MTRIDTGAKPPLPVLAHATDDAVPTRVPVSDRVLALLKDPAPSPELERVIHGWVGLFERR